MKYIFPILATAFLFSCGNNDGAKTNLDSTIQTESTTLQISNVQPYRPAIEATPWDGDLSDAIYWKDSRGENAVIVSIKPQYFWEEENPKAKDFFPKDEDPETLMELTEVFVTHYVMKLGETKWSQFNLHHDYLFGCCDVFMAYQPASLQVMDADSDGVGEYFLMYHHTEGDGLMGQSFDGTLLLEHDSTFFTIKGFTGLGAEMAASGAETPAELKLNIPRKGVYSSLMTDKWKELYDAKVEQDRAEVTERNNVDEDGHADHTH